MKLKFFVFLLLCSNVALANSICYVMDEQFDKLNLSSCDENGFNEALNSVAQNGEQYFIWQFKNNHEIAVTSIFSGSNYAEKGLNHFSIPYKKNKNIISRINSNDCISREKIVFEDKKTLNLEQLGAYKNCDDKQKVVLDSMKGSIFHYVKVY